MAFLVVALLFVSGVFYLASINFHHGFYWADQVCGEVQFFCDHPLWLLAATGAVIVAGLIRQMIKG